MRDPSIRINNGSVGQQTLEQMTQVLATSFNGRCRLVYNEKTKIFTILNSKEISYQNIMDVFSKCTFTIWEPRLIDSTDHEGNKMVNLVALPVPERKSEHWPPENELKKLLLMAQEKNYFRTLLQNPQSS